MGLGPEDYGLAPGEKLNEAIARSWNRLTGLWRLFRKWIDAQPAADFATGETRKRWLVPLLAELGYGPLSLASGLTIDGREYPISHLYQHAPVHLLGWRLDLDTRTAEAAGAARRSPHSLVQEFLNRSDAHLWALLSNGRQFRLLRDSARLTRQAFVEFDLESMFDGEVYPDFALLWLVAHASRVAGDRPEECWLEQWTRHARETGIRALDRLRDGVQGAIEILGRGFVRHPANDALRGRLRSGALDQQDLYRQVLRLVYRLLFLAVAEERGLLHAPGVDAGVRERYSRFYSFSRLRRVADRRRGTRHGDLWQALRLVLGFLGVDEGCNAIGLAGLGGSLWSEDSVRDLACAELENVDLSAAIRSLSSTERDGIRYPVDYGSIRSEELGSVYESLLELHPRLDVDAGCFELHVVEGHERKTTGSYYTPDFLVQRLLDSTLEPAIRDVLRSAVGPDAEAAAILSLKVCDPACGSGHFLVAAAHRLARHLAAARTRDDEPAPESYRTALRDVIGRCIFGVDLNPMAVELCKVALWMEALEPGRPLSYLERHVVYGDSLLGTTPELLEAGIPDEAFTPVEGDDRDACRVAARNNEAERAGQASLFEGPHVSYYDQVASIAAALSEVEAMGDQTADAEHAKEARLEGVFDLPAYRQACQAADMWCSAFLSTKTVRPDPASNRYLLLLDDRASRKPLNWWLEFPHVLAARSVGPREERAGFDVVLGNPPWLSYSGRQRAAIDPHVLRLLAFVFPEVKAWPSSHGAFLVLATRILKTGGRFGLVLPLQVAFQDGYAASRGAVCAACGQAPVVVDVGESAFPGVSQAVGLFSGCTSPQAHPRIEAPWVVPATAETSASAGCVAVEPLSRVLAALRAIAAERRFPEGVFSDPGVHSGNVAKKIVRNDFPADDIRYPLVREGRDIGAYFCGPAANRLWLEPTLEEGEYCRIRPLERYCAARIVLRQTASRPIATRHFKPTYFRNSILACAGIDGVPDEVLVAVLNSCLIAYWHRNSTGDARQRAFPQVKIGHLRGLPMFDVSRLTGPVKAGDTESLASVLLRHVREVEELVRAPNDFESLADSRVQLELGVLQLYGLDTGLANHLMEAVDAG
jgi:hypothetical protein